MRLNPQTYAATLIAHERRSLVQRAANAELLIATILRYRDQGKFLLHGFAVMPDHVHILLTPTEAIERTIGLIKGGFSFALRKQYPGAIWQTGYHAHRITDASDYDNQMAYIAQNPIRKGLTNYPHVHTSNGATLDPIPSAFVTKCP